MPSQPFVFVSYARADREEVQAVVLALHELGIDTWVDSDNLSAGELWAESIDKALHNANAVIAFISPASAKSEWMLSELNQAASSGAKIIPVMLQPTPVANVHPFLLALHYIDYSKFSPERAPRSAAAEIAHALSFGPKPTLGNQLNSAQTQDLAKALAAQSRTVATGREDLEKAASPTSVFIVHGHDDDFLSDVASFVRELGITPIVMRDAGGSSTSLIEKFFDVGGAARYAIVLLSGDDFGVSRVQYEAAEGGEKAMQFRARQNVVLELGYFYGLLGWENVFVLERAPARVFPNFERPSDLNGVLFDRYDNSGKWRNELHRRLTTHGFALPPLT